jgi:hypothetical protein
MKTTMRSDITTIELLESFWKIHWDSYTPTTRTTRRGRLVVMAASLLDDRVSAKGIITELKRQNVNYGTERPAAASHEAWVARYLPGPLPARPRARQLLVADAALARTVGGTVDPGALQAGPPNHGRGSHSLPCSDGWADLPDHANLLSVYREGHPLGRRHGPPEARPPDRPATDHTPARRRARRPRPGPRRVEHHGGRVRPPPPDPAIVFTVIQYRTVFSLIG